MSEFQLAEWEVGPRCQEPLTGAVHGTTQEGGEWRAVEMLPYRFVVFVRGEQGQGNWVVRQDASDQPRIWFSDAPTLEIAFPERGRLFVWDGQMAFVAPNGDGAWLDAELRAQAPFNATVPSEIIKGSSRETFDFLSRQLERDCDFAFARKWAQDDTDGWVILLGGERNHNAVTQILRAVLCKVDEQAGYTKSSWHLSHLFPGGAYAYSSSGDREHGAHLEKLLTPWSQFFAFEFLPRHMQEARKRHRCLEEFYNSRGSYFKVGSDETPTYHERLEARLRLREWLQQNAPDRMDLLAGL